MVKTVTMEMDEVIKLTKSALAKEEFFQAFKKVMEHIKKIDARNVSDVKAMKQNLGQLSKQIDSKASGNIEKAKKGAIASMRKELSRLERDHTKLILAVERKLSQVQNGVNGVDADEERVIVEVLKRVLEPTISGVEENIPSLGVPVKDSLEALEGDNRLDVSAIKGLEEIIRKSTHKSSSGTIVGGGVNAVRYYDLSASLNGSTKTFSLPAFARILDVKLSSVPVMRQTTDYTINGTDSKITFTSEITASQDLASGQSCIVLYSE